MKSSTIYAQAFRKPLYSSWADKDKTFVHQKVALALTVKELQMI